MRGFPTLDHIRNAVAELQDLVPHYGDSEWRLFPRLEFHCNGVINEVTVVGRVNSSIGLGLQLWAPMPPTTPLPTPPLPLNNARNNGRNNDSTTPGPPDDRQTEDASCMEFRSLKIRRPDIDFDENQFSATINDAPVQVGTILGVRHEGLTLLYRKADAGPPTYIYPPMEDKLCIDRDGTNGNYDYPLISVQLGI